MPSQRRNKSHFFLGAHGEHQRYTSPRLAFPNSFPARSRSRHAAALENALTMAIAKGVELVSQRNPLISGGEAGFHLEFEIPARCADIADKLENKQGKHIELLSVKPSQNNQNVIATVFIPETRKEYYLKKIAQYKNETTPTGRPKNEPLVASIDAIRLAGLTSVFTDNPSLFPENNTQVWWEVWVAPERKDLFISAARTLNITVQEHPIEFAERTILLALSNVENLQLILNNTNSIAELRIARDSPTIFMNMNIGTERTWSDDLLSRITVANENNSVVCILDSGCNRAHPLLEPHLNDADCQTYDASWLPADNSNKWHGHGTGMAGLAVYGDLSTSLLSSSPIEIKHALETVKILPNTGDNHPRLYSHITGAAIALAEQQAPQRKRTICMAVTAPNDYWQCRPSSWSAAVDDLAYNNGDDGRLITISVGNIRDRLSEVDYIDRNDISPVENPSQAWNALAVGAYTEKLDITHPDYTSWQPLAPHGGISPRSRTSVGIKRWPIKPEIVLEGGNLGLAPSASHAEDIDDLALLTTHNKHQISLFTPFAHTSAATALASRMAAQISAEKQELWPETVRALMVHSAEWTTQMLSHLPPNPTKDNYCTLLGRCGYGVPNLSRALSSMNNDITMVIENTMQPFMLEDGRTKTRDLVLHELPWPSQILEELENSPVEMKVTLSYFIEPNPGERGWTYHHRYASHGLRFIAKSATETIRAFKGRINSIAREEEETYQSTAAGDNEWLIGKRRDRGSIHSDIWRGSAVELAAKSAIAVYPVGGWWKEKPALTRTERHSRYALIISLRAPTNTQADLYTPIANIVTPNIEIEVSN